MGARQHIFKKVFLVSLVGLFIAPQIALAVWWNPFTWKIFQRAPTTPPQVQIQATTTVDQSAEIERLQKEVTELKKPSTSTPQKVAPPHVTTKTQTAITPEKVSDSQSLTDAQNLGKQLGEQVRNLVTLDESIERLEKILAEAKASEKRFADYAENSSSQRAQSLEALASNVSNANTKQFILNTANFHREYNANARSDYHKLYSPLLDAIDLWLEKILVTRGDVNQAIPPDDLDKTLAKDISEQERFISLIAYANKVAYDRETAHAEGFTQDLKYVRSLLLLDETLASVNLRLGEIEQSAISAKTPSTEIRCFATTQYSGGLVNGRSETSVRCE